MNKHVDQRVGVFIDIQNLYYSAKQFYNAKVNFAHILKRAVAGRKLIKAIAYVIKADIKEENNFFEALSKIGYDVRSKDLQTFYTGAKKGDWDVGIAMDIMRMASKLDVVVLVSGDGDFKDLMEHCKALGCRAEAIAFKKTCSSRLLNEVDEFTDLGKELDKVLIRDYKNKPAQNRQIDLTKNNKNAQLDIEMPVQKTVGKKILVQKKPFVKKPFVKKPYQKKPFVKKPFQQKSYDKKPYQQKPFQRRSYDNNSNDSNDEASLLQKLNMDQPDLVPKKDTNLQMPKGDKKKPVVKKPVAKKSIPKKKATTKKATKEAIKKPAAKKSIPKKKAITKKPVKKKESLVEKVIKRVTKKK
mgnify:CR=1 FL=1